MLNDLKIVQDDLYQPQSLKKFLQIHPIPEVMKLLNKTPKKETQTRLEYFFSRLGRGNQLYQSLMNLYLDKDPQVQQEFQKYVMSDRSQAYFNMLLAHPAQTLNILQHHPKAGEGLYKMLSGENGLKMIKVITKLYNTYGNHDCLYTEGIHQVLRQGVQHQNSEIKMRYVQVVANIATTTRGYNFIQNTSEESLLDKVLTIYSTQDMLLKMNIVQTVSLLGQGADSSKFLYNHKIWKQVEREAMDPAQEFYIRKSLLVLLIDMNSQGHIQMSTQVRKNIAAFLQECIQQKGQYAQGALQLIQHCFHSLESAKIIIGSTKIFQRYCLFSRTNEDRLKVPYLDTLVSLTGISSPSNSKSLVINILNCIGNPNLCTTTSHNIHANNHMIEGLAAFTKWFIDFLQLPFEDFELRLITILYNLVDYLDVALEIFKDDRMTKYLVKRVSNLDNKVLKDRKASVIRKIILKAQKEWKGLQLEAYCHMLEKELKGSAMELQYALDVQ